MGDMNTVEQYKDQTHLKLDPNITFEQWLDIGYKLTRTAQNIMWWIGDWWNFGERKYGEQASAALDLEIPYSTFQNAAWVARSIELDRREPRLSWSHHLEVASLDQSSQDKFLQESINNSWSTKRLREEVKRKIIQDSLEPGDTSADPMLFNNINIKATNFWTFGKPLEMYGVDDERKTPGQLIANLFYWYVDSDESNKAKVVDLTDKYSVTADVAKDFGYKYKGYDLYPSAGVNGITAIDFTIDPYPESISEADVVILNMMDYVDNTADIDPEAFLKKQLIDLGTVMKKGSQLFVISQDFDDWKIENTFQLIYEENDFAVNDLIFTKNKELYSRDEEISAISSKNLLDQQAYILILQNIEADK